MPRPLRQFAVQSLQPGPKGHGSRWPADISRNAEWIRVLRRCEREIEFDDRPKDGPGEQRCIGKRSLTDSLREDRFIKLIGGKLGIEFHVAEPICTNKFIGFVGKDVADL